MWYNLIMSKKIKFIILALALVVVVGGSITIAALSVYKPDAVKGLFNKPYTVVYLTSGEIYIGRLSTFPRLILDDSYILQMAPNEEDPGQTGFQLMPLSNTLWAPQRIYLNRDHIIFTAPVRDDSQVAQTLKGNIDRRAGDNIDRTGDNIDGGDTPNPQSIPQSIPQL